MNLSEVIPDPHSSELQLNIRQILSNPIVCTWWVRGQSWRLKSWFQGWNSAATHSQQKPCTNKHYTSSCLPCLISGVGMGWGLVHYLWHHHFSVKKINELFCACVITILDCCFVFFRLSLWSSSWLYLELPNLHWSLNVGHENGYTY